MIRVQSACLVALLLITGCDGDSEPRKVASIVVPEGDYKQRLDALTEPQLNAVFLRAVRDTGQDCQSVAGSAYNGVHFGMPGWVARCSDGRDWLVMLGKGGRAHVARREEARQGKQ